VLEVNSATEPRRLHIVMASYADLAFDSRVQREAIALVGAGHRVTLLCLEPGGDLPASLTSAVEVVARYPDGVPPSSNPFAANGTCPFGRSLDRARWVLRYQRAAANWGRWAVQVAGPADVWHLHDFPALAAIGDRLAPETPFVYDSHELFMETGTAARLPGPLRAILRRRERRLARRAVALVTVSDACAVALRPLGAPRTVVVENFPTTSDEVHDDGRLRHAIGTPPGVPVVLAHGALAAERGLQELVAAVASPQLAGVHLVFMGFGALGAQLIAESRSLGIVDRVHLLPAVPPDDVLAWVSGADICAMPLQPTNRNQLVAAPNKLFESLAAGVPVVASDFPGFRGVICDGPEGPLGAVCEPTNVAAIADAIKGLLAAPRAESDALRERCRRASSQRMRWHHAATRLVGLYSDLSAMIGIDARGATQAMGIDGDARGGARG
jgi:glycosyltransferase involved in cell wall biosynthesis